MVWLALEFGVRSAVAWGALVAALWCRGTLSAKSGCFGPVVTRVHGRGVWLTIDDGPDPSTTPALLDLLDEHGVKATFFVIGNKVREHPELARGMVARGHRLGNHTAAHPVASFWCAGPWRTRREIAEGWRAIVEATGIPPVWFRAPVGHRNYFTHPFATALGMRVVGWNRRGLDGTSTNVRAILARLLGAVADGDVVVTHDARPAAGEVLRGLLEGLREKGIEIRQPDDGQGMA
jgi:peptidoglycan/xylan/chitin deacetylase (PgdA/CDA1 family)